MIPVNDKGKSDPGHWNTASIMKRAGKTAIKYKDIQPQGAALALSKKIKKTSTKNDNVMPRKQHPGF